MKRTMVYLGILAAMGAGIYLAGQTQAQAPVTASKGRVAVFNVAKVMRNYEKWQYFAKMMNERRLEAARQLGGLRNEIADIQAKVQNPATPQTEKEKLSQSLVTKQREFEDRERQARKSLDDESANHLKLLYGEIQQAVRAIVDTNGFDLVLAYPDAVTDEEKSSPVYFDLKLRPQAAMPFFVSGSADMTDVLVLTLNKNFPPPQPVQPAGATNTVPTPGK
mgnify:CR=1 FL=1